MTTEGASKEARRGQILDAAFAEFTLKGYGGASMEAIARRANASKETLYAWFGNKETLFDTLMVSRIEGIAERAGAAAETDPSPGNVLAVIAEDILRLMLAVTPLLQGIQPGGQGGAALRRLGVTVAEWRKGFIDHMLEWRADGMIAFDDDPFEVVSIFVAMAEGEWGLRLATGLLDEVTDQMIADHARRVTRIFLRGLAPPSRPSPTPAAPARGP